MTIRAIYENGVFKPTEKVDLPEQTAVEVSLPDLVAPVDANQQAIFELMKLRFSSGETDVAERHNEHQP